MSVYRWVKKDLSNGGVDLLAVRSCERLFLGKSPLAGIDSVKDYYWKLAPRYYRWKFSQELRAYEDPPDPFKIVRVDPARIKRYTGRPFPPWRDREYLFGRVESGDWDQRNPQRHPDAEQSLSIAERFSESVLYESFQMHFEDGVPWDDTELYREDIRRLEDDTYDWPQTKSDLDRRYATLDTLYETIREEGYSTQAELRKQEDNIGGGFGNNNRPKGFLERFAHEVAVDIGRDGDLLFVDGRHRLAIAKILGLKRLPVTILVRHAKWMELRERVDPDKLDPCHPDLCDL